MLLHSLRKKNMVSLKFRLHRSSISLHCLLTSPFLSPISPNLLIFFLLLLPPQSILILFPPSPKLSAASLSSSFSKAELIHLHLCQPHHHFPVPVVFPKANAFAFWNFIPLFSQSNALENFTDKAKFSRLSSKNLRLTG